MQRRPAHLGPLRIDAREEAGEVAGRLDALFAAPGAALTVAAVAPEPSPYGGPGDHSGAEERERFRLALAGHDAAYAPTTNGPGPMEDDR